VTPVFVDVKAIDLNVIGDALSERLERRVNSQRRRDQVDQRRFVSDSSLTEELRLGYVTAPAMCLYTSPVISALQHVLAVF
jgi:hypothetical protein